MPDIGALLPKIFRFQDSIPSVEQDINEPSMLRTELAIRDPTCLCEIHKRYEEHVEILLKSSDAELVDYIEPQELQIFRDTYSSRSFFCRYTACASRVTGSNSQAVRDQHEATHIWKYKCKVLNCFRERQGFKKQRDLKLHYQKYYHPSTEVPKLILAPSLTPASLSGIIDGPGILDGLRIDYAPDVKRSFSIKLLYEIQFNSVPCSTAISPGQHFFAAAANLTVNLFSLETGKEVWTFDISVGEASDVGKDNYGRDVCFSPDGFSLIAGAECGRIMVRFQSQIGAQIWDVANKGCKAIGIGHEDSVYALAASSNGKWVASASGDKTARVWNMSGHEIAKFESNDCLTSIKFLPDQRYLLFASIDRTISVVNWQDGSLVAKLEGHADSVYGVDVLPKSNRFISAGLDHNAIIWSWQKSAGKGGIEGASEFSVGKILTGHKV
ncbi:MAG: hypothetical protein Q9227_005405 [Pyrenula ochraceoflavens]